MTWFKIDDGFYDHPKVVALMGKKAAEKSLNLWTFAGCWSAKQLTNGFIPTAQLARLGYTKAHARNLVDAGLWHAVDGGFRFHEWEEHQPTREVVEKRREESRERVRRHREAKQRECNALQTRPVTEGETPPRPDPTRPVLKTPPNPPSGERPQPEAVAAVYARATGNADLPSCQLEWDRFGKQEAAVAQMARWSGGDLEKLERELRALVAQDPKWLARQPVHVIVQRLGTAKHEPSELVHPSWRPRPKVKHDPTPRPRHRPARGTA